MNKRLKYAKLRLANSAACPKAVAEEQTNTENTNTGLHLLRTEKTSTFFAKPCSKHNTPIEEEKVKVADSNKTSNIPHSQKKTTSPGHMNSSEGPKLPKLPKTVSKADGLISNFLNSYTYEDDDFEKTNNSIDSHPKQTKVQRAAKKSKGLSKSKLQADIRKIFENRKTDDEVLHEIIKCHSASEQIDPDQLQMALALSRSLADQECISNSSAITEIQCNPETSSYSLQDRRIVGIRTTLEQFGFQCKNSYTDYDLNVIGMECRHVKKIRHKRATKLQRRTKLELDDFIDRQVNNFFPVAEKTMRNASYPAFSTEILPSYSSSLFWIAQTEQSSNILLDQYYVPHLVEIKPAPVDCLLKDWNNICGRETTPERQHCATIRFDNAYSPYATTSLGKRSRVKSPDLFDEFEDSIVHLPSSADRPAPIAHLNRTFKDNNSENEIKRSLSNSTIHKEARMHKNQRILVFELDEIESVKQNTEDPAVQLNEDTSGGNENEQSIALYSTTAEVTVFDRSAENLFEATYMDPIISFEAYSREEEKISPQTTKKRTSSNVNEHLQNQIAVPSVCGEQLFNTQPSVTPTRAILPISDRQPHVPAKVNTTIPTLHPIRGEEDFSFNRIAVRGRVSEALKNCAYRLETVDLVNLHQTIHDESTKAEKSNLDCHEKVNEIRKTRTEDDVLHISRDANYSVCKLSMLPGDECIPMPAFHCTGEDDCNTTELYSIDDSRFSIQSLGKERFVPTNSKRIIHETSSDSYHQNVSSNAKDHEYTPNVKCAEKTFSYLDSLIKHYDLLPLQLRTVCNGDIASEHLKFNSSRISKHVICSTTMLEKNESPTKCVSCTSLVRTKKHLCFLPHTVSESDALLSSKHSQRNTGEDNCNGKMVQQLEILVPEEKFPQYFISVKHADFQPPLYETMSTTQIERELFMHGLKAMKRSKATEVLRHLFKKTHMFVHMEDNTDYDIERSHEHRNRQRYAQLASICSSSDSTPFPLFSKQNNPCRTCAFQLESPYDVDLFLPLKPRKKITWTMVPLHIAFYNLVSESAELQRQILLYHPINFEEICHLLKEVGLHYDKNDLVTFLDKLCITFQYTSSSGGRMKIIANYGKK